MTTTSTLRDPEKTAPAPAGRAGLPAFIRSDLFGIGVLVAVLLILGFTLTRADWLLQGTLAIALAIAATGLGLALGLGGEFVLSISLIVAAGAYTAAVLTSSFEWSFWPAGLVGMAAAILVGVLLSLPGLRVSSFYFGMLGFFLVFLVPAIVQMFSTWTGGSSGLAVLEVPELFGENLDANGMFILATIGLGIALLLYRNVRASPLGVQLRRMRDSPVALATTGTAVWKVRLAAYVLCSVLAGLGGAIYSHTSGFLQPDEFGFATTNLILAAVVVGGSRSLLGPSIGVLVLFIVPRVVVNIEGYTDIVYGAVVLLSVLLFRGGIAQALRDAAAWVRKRRGGKASSTTEPLVQTIARSPEALAALIGGVRSKEIGSHTVTVRGVRKRYGGVAALDLDDDDTLVLKTGEVHLLLGPNGSGKTTMLNAITGLVPLDAGSVQLDGRDLAGLGVAKIAEAGVSRSFQGPALPDEVTPIELFAARLAAGRKVSYLHWLSSDIRAARVRRETRELAEKIADAAGLGAAAHAECVGLTSGQRRIVDVVDSMLSTTSSIILLDEPAAGLSDPEREQLATTIRALANRGIGFIVVEHDLDLALGLADTVTVMAAGRPVAQGTPDQIREDPVVREVLIGAIEE